MLVKFAKKKKVKQMTKDDREMSADKSFFHS